METSSSGGNAIPQNAFDHIPLAGMPLLWYSLAFLFGVVLAHRVSLPIWGWMAIALILIALPLLSQSKHLSNDRLSRWATRLDNFLQRRLYRSTATLRTALLVLTVSALGAARYQSVQAQLTPASLAWYNDLDHEWVVVGVVIDPPDKRDTYTNLRVSVERIRPAGKSQHREVGGFLLARLPGDQSFRYGDRLVLRGDLLTPPVNPEFSYRDYLARQGIFSYMPYARAALLSTGAGNPFKSAIYSLRAAAAENLYRLFPNPEASLLTGILLGDESGISPDVQEAFMLTGAAHIVVISGFNITILAGAFLWLFLPRLGYGRGALLSAFLVSVYVLLVGADPPVVRAAVMGCLGLLAGFLGRRQAGLNSLTFSAAVMVLLTPTLLWDVSFQLSFAATLGLVLFAHPLEEYFQAVAAPHIPAAVLKRTIRMIGEFFLFTMAATLTTLPVILFHFQRLSLVSLPVNLFVLPVQPAVMIIAGIALVLSLLWYPIGWVLSFVAWPFAAYTNRVVEWFAAVPGASLATGEIGIFSIAVYYSVLFVVAFKPAWLAARKHWFRPAWVVFAVGSLLVVIWNLAAAAPDGRLHITFLDVGGQEAFLVRTPAGREILIGGGDRISLLSDALGRRLPVVDRGMDWLVVASPLEESLAALPRIVERFPPGQVLWAGAPNASYSARRLEEALVAASIPITFVESGHRLDLGSGAYLEMLSVNRRGAVILIAWDRFRLLLPTAQGFDELEAFSYGRTIGPVSVLHLAASGYAPLNPPEWIQNLSPRLVILTVAPGNVEGLPSQETVSSLSGFSLLRTDRNGWIQVSTDGERFWVVAERAAD